MTGSLAVKNGKYYAVLNVYENGTRKKKWICSELPEKGNKRKAEQFLREKLAEYERMEGIVLTDVTYQLLQQYIDIKSKSGRLDGKGGLSPSTLRHHKNILTQALDLAVKNKLIPSNPCQFVIMPPMERYESSFYNDRQLQQMFNAFKDEPLLPLVQITALYGLRRSELLGLQWDSIDFARKTMTIRHTVARVTKVVAKDKTKNASSHRSFPLTEEALGIFRAAKQAEERNRKVLAPAT